MTIFKRSNTKASTSKPKTSNSFGALAEVDETGISKMHLDDQRTSQQRYTPARAAPKGKTPTNMRPPTQVPARGPPQAVPARDFALDQRAVSRAATNDHWRTPDPRPARGFAPANNPTPEYQGLDKDRVSIMTRESCVVGKIFRAAVHEQDFADIPGWSGAIDDTKTVLTHAGSVYSKVRWMIVVSIYNTHYMAIPLYTHNGKGLANKSDDAKREYSSVHDGRVRRVGFENLSVDNPVLEAEMYDGTTILSKMTVAHLTAPLQRKFGLYVEEQGILHPNSAERMVQLWRSKL